jgi:hypothetical protein
MAGRRDRAETAARCYKRPEGKGGTASHLQGIGLPVDAKGVAGSWVNIAITLVALGAAAACGSAQSGGRAGAGVDAGQDTESDTAVQHDAAVQQDTGALADGGTNLRCPISLTIPDALASRGLVPLASAAAIAGTGRWISAQTEGAQGVRGPVLVYEGRSDGSWALADIPATKHAFYPALCAVSATEAYVAVADWPSLGGPGPGRIFARSPGGAATFVEQSAPTPAGYNVEGWGLSCFPGGNLWIYGTIHPASAPTSRQTVIYHRSATTGDWKSVPLPADAAAVGDVGAVIALIRADGSGYFAMSHRSGRQGLFERLPDGSWRESLVLDTGNWVANLAGDPGGHAIGAVNALEAKYVELRQGTWSLRPATGFAALRGAARSPRGLMVTGAIQVGPVAFRMAVAHEPDFVPLQLGLEGFVSQVVFPAETADPALVVTYNSPSLITACEWSP